VRDFLRGFLRYAYLLLKKNTCAMVVTCRISMRFRALLCASLLLFCASRSFSQDVIAMLSQRADSLVKEEMRKQNIAGLTLTIVMDKKIVVSRAYGFADLENQAPVTTATLFRTGSIAKPITSTAAMALYQAGRLDLDAPVQKYCPAFPQKQWTITTRELLGHLSGIRHYKQDDSDVFSTKHYAHISDAFEMFAGDPLLFEPGTKMQYTTFGYDVVGCVIEGASGEDFVTALNTLVLAPAGMRSTRTDDAFVIIPHRSRPYTLAADHSLRNSPFVDTSNKIPGGGLVSTADDLARFAIALESGGLLSSATAQLMWTSQKTSDGKATGYGYGWGVGDANGVRTVGHTGGQPGCSSVLWMLPDRGFAVSIMTNTDEVKVQPIAEALTKAYLQAHRASGK
jgi:serine beta-lactamase-like protein LACTB